MIEEVTELPGGALSASSAPTAPTDSANGESANGEASPAEKPKRRRVVKKSADAELPLDGMEGAEDAPAKPKRAPRKKKTDDAPAESALNAQTTPTAESAGDAEAAVPSKPKRAPRKKKTDDDAPATSADSAANSEAKADRAPAVEQTSASGPAPFQMAPAVAMGSFTPSPEQAEARAESAPNPRVSRNQNREEQPVETESKSDDSTQGHGQSNAEDGETTGPNTNRNTGEESSDDDDFRNSRLSYRDRRAMRREQRIVARTGREEETVDSEDSSVDARGNRNNRNNRDGGREGENRGNDNRNGDNRGNENRDNEARNGENRGGDTRSNDNRNNDNRGDRNANRNNRDRNNARSNDARGNDNRGDRNNNRNGRNDNRNDREPRELREPREPRRERNGGRNNDHDLTALRAMDAEALQAVVVELNMEAAPGETEALIYAILEAQANAQNAILKKGILDILPDQKGFLRCENYYPSEGDVYVSQTQIKRFGLKTGDEVLGTARVPKENERYHGLLRVESINGLSIEESRGRRDFEKLTPIFPTERFPLETEPENITARIIDLISPIGKGQRGLIVAPPKAGKTTLIKNIANSITENNPEVLLFVLLIDERPEEVTDISRSVRGEVVASTFDEVPENHIRVSDIVMERAKRLVEMGKDVVVLMDSITRLSRASNLVVAPSGRTMSGGLDPAAMYKPKRHFGAARNIEFGGSLTVLATVLVDTGSRMDEYIFEELKGTGNLDLVLDRDLFNQRIFPAIDINRSGTRRDELLLSKEELAATFHLRRTLAALDNDKAVTLLIDRLKNTKTNADFMEVVAKSQRNAGPGS